MLLMKFLTHLLEISFASRIFLVLLHLLKDNFLLTCVLGLFKTSGTTTIDNIVELRELERSHLFFNSLRLLKKSLGFSRIDWV
jgi:hypothetical protein